MKTQFIAGTAALNRKQQQQIKGGITAEPTLLKCVVGGQLRRCFDTLGQCLQFCTPLGGRCRRDLDGVCFG
jgi:hypothetical protein